MIIDFSKPVKVERGGGFDGGWDGGYEPQMSPTDALKWRGKYVNKGKDGARIEIKKRFQNGTMIVLIVAKDGWEYKNESRTPKDSIYYDMINSTGKNVRISMNGALILTMDQFVEINKVVEEAWSLLHSD